jgi:hypothetical protein
LIRRPEDRGRWRIRSRFRRCATSVRPGLGLAAAPVEPRLDCDAQTAIAHRLVAGAGLAASGHTQLADDLSRLGVVACASGPALRGRSSGFRAGVVTTRHSG